MLCVEFRTCNSLSYLTTGYNAKRIDSTISSELSLSVAPDVAFVNPKLYQMDGTTKIFLRINSYPIPTCALRLNVFAFAILPVVKMRSGLVEFAAHAAPLGSVALVSDVLLSISDGFTPAITTNGVLPRLSLYIIPSVKRDTIRSARNWARTEVVSGLFVLNAATIPFVVNVVGVLWYSVVMMIDDFEFFGSPIKNSALSPPINPLPVPLTCCVVPLSISNVLV